MLGVEQAGRPNGEGLGSGDWEEIGGKRSAVHGQRQGSPRGPACASASWSLMACGCARRRKSGGKSRSAAMPRTEPSVETELPCSQPVRRIRRRWERAGLSVTRPNSRSSVPGSPHSNRTGPASVDRGHVRVRGAFPGRAIRPGSAGPGRGVDRDPSATASQDSRGHRTRTTRSIPAADRTLGSNAVRPRPTRDDGRRRTRRAPAPRRSAADAAAAADVRRSRLRAAAGELPSQ